MAGESAIVVAIEQLGRFQERSAEEARAAARDIGRRFDRFEDAVAKRFDGIDERIGEVCDYRLREHGEFSAGIAALADRLDAKDAEARGRAQVWAGFGKTSAFLVEHAWQLIALGLAVWTTADDILPAAIAAATPAPIAEMIAPAAYAQIPRDPYALRGPQD